MPNKTLPPQVRSALREVKEALSAVYGDRLKGLYLYGSYARGDFTEGSDLDLVIALAGHVNPWREVGRLSERLADISLRYDLLISTYPVPDDWLRERKSPLFENVRREGVLI